MKEEKLNIVILGLSITSSWGNGHATTYRGLVRELSKRGHEVLFLERDSPWYAAHRDLPDPAYCKIGLYRTLAELKEHYESPVINADLVIVGSYVADGVAVSEWVMETAEGAKAFYDIDTPVTMAKLAKGDHEYLHPSLIHQFDLYLSFTGGPTLDVLEEHYGSPMARPLYCSFDPELYYPEEKEKKWDLGYIGTYSADRQPTLEKLLIQPAKQLRWGSFAVAGPQYPADIEWPRNVQRIEHLPPPAEHRDFYNCQCFTLNVTRADMIRAGYSPSVRLFEAAACGMPIISDHWEGLSSFFDLNEEILIANSTLDVIHFLKEMPEKERNEIGERARQKVLKHHTAAHRAEELENYAYELLKVESVPQKLNISTY